MTGSTGLIGSAVIARFGTAATVPISRRQGVDIADVEALTTAFADGEVVVHAAGINREIGWQTYQRVHVDGTRTVVEAARRAGVGRIILLSYLRARPTCGSAYHESKAAAEDIVRASGIPFTILKPGIVHGRGDHLADHLARTACTVPLFATVGVPERAQIVPLPVAELVDVIEAAVQGRLENRTLAIIGHEHLARSEAMHRVARVTGRRVLVFGLPVWFHRALGALTEATMWVPLLAARKRGCCRRV